ncbi:hypothetical protein [Primorskyibacter marinus]|uniref:hypothetical protein n=1 Tax=Primorskyibacter marinus TaxID=1977320 RepID=UPI000E3004D1|nr:hypothetical protein [Primorskyibacter marinus]
MTDKQQDSDGLDAFFDAARNTAPAPDAAFMARILDDALSVQAEAVAPPSPVTKREGLFSQILRGIGGWPALTGLAAATVAGVWIGVNPPAAVSDQLASLIGTSSATTDATDSDWLLDPLTEYDIAMTGG